MKKFGFSFLGGLLVVQILSACGGSEELTVNALSTQQVQAAAALPEPEMIPGSSCAAANNCPGEIFPTGPGAVQNIGVMVQTAAGPVCTIKAPGNEACGQRGVKICTACPAMDGTPAYTLCNWEPAAAPPVQVCPYYYNQRER